MDDMDDMDAWYEPFDEYEPPDPDWSEHFDDYESDYWEEYLSGPDEADIERYYDKMLDKNGPDELDSLFMEWLESKAASEGRLSRKKKRDT